MGVQQGEHSCCEGNHDAAEGKVLPKAYFCPMCRGVESDKPGACPKCGMALESATPHAAGGRTIYTCPMHPEIQQDHPGPCPKCGMALELKTITAAPEDDSELRDMTRRFWIGAAFALPVFVLAMAHLIPSAPHWTMGNVARWVQFALATPVVLRAGWPFFVRG